MSPFSGQLFTQPRTGLCHRKYKELKGAHRIAHDLLLVGPSKEPIYANDPILARALPKRYKEHSEWMASPSSENSLIQGSGSVFRFNLKNNFLTGF